MNLHQTTKIRKNSFSFTSLSLAIVAIFMGGLLSILPSHRQYFPMGISTQDDGDDSKDAIGMEQFFFTARKNITTNKMDYASMLAADIADRAMNGTRRTHAVTSTTPKYNWISMGPTNIGGRTRAILIDNTDPSHQTIFAGGVSGGIWKSTNGGGTWGNVSAALSYSLNDTLSNINVSCIAQDANGAIYIGTGEGFTIYQQGEGFSTGILGGGIFKSTDDGATWRLLKTTQPVANNNSVTWAYVNRIAIRPDNFKVIYAATQGGLLVSHDSGATWRSAYKSPATKISGGTWNALDVKISTDGSIVMACVGGAAIGNDPSTAGCYGYYCYPQSAPDSIFTEIKSTGAGELKGNACRIEFAISPTDANRVYASVIQDNGVFGAAGTGSGIFMTMNAKTSGGYWHEIGPGGSSAFDPYMSAFDQANYDNTVGVPPANEAQVLVGGARLWEWSGANTSDTVGSWQEVSHYNPYFAGDPLWIHADEHAIVFDNNNPSTVYFGCDGGLFKCSNWYINPSTPTISITHLDIQQINRNYNVTQYYTVCYSPEVNYVSVDNNNNSMVEGLGLGGGTQDNGSPYVNGVSIPHYPNDGIDLSSGDGAGCSVSQLDPNIAYFCSDYGSLLREGNLGTISFPTSAYTQTKGYNEGGNIDSVESYAYGHGASCFVFPLALYENRYDTLNLDSLTYINTSDSNYIAGNTIWPLSTNGEITYPYILPKALAKGDTLTVPDRVVSRLAVGFTGSNGGVWINGQGASSGTVIWMPIAGPLSKPDAFTGSSPVHAIAWAPDGNTLYIGTEGGQMFRFSNINSIIAGKYKSGALWSNGGTRGIVDTSNQVISTNLGNMFSGRDILSIAVDPTNGNNILVTLGNYGNGDYVYYSTNADSSATPTFVAVQGTLPAMPVYGSIIHLMDSTGNWIANSAMLGTEHGIYTTTTLGSTNKWVKNSMHLPNVMTLAIKQQTQPSWLCNNSGDIYAGTHGRGLWAIRSSITTAVPTISASAAALNNLLIYPNPMTSQGNIEFNLASADIITINIYDMQGHIVKTLNMGNQSQGNHLVTFASEGLRGGTYFASLTGTNFRKVSKFIVVN